MEIEEIESYIGKVPDYPKPGILFYDISTLIINKDVFSSTIEKLSEQISDYQFDSIAAIDARGFIFGSAISLQSMKPMVVARKPGKLPGDTIKQSYNLEYGSSSLSIQKSSLNKYKSYAIVDDLLATGGTVNCVSNLLKSHGKEILGLLTVVELSELNGRFKFDFPVESSIIF